MARRRSSHRAQSRFATIPQIRVPRSLFDRSSNLKTTFNAGLLIPIFVDEALPGDTFRMRCTTFGRLATPLHPIMDNLTLETFWFFVPNRILWDNWEAMNGDVKAPSQGGWVDPQQFKVPVVTTPATTGWSALELGDYFGLPTAIEGVRNPAAFHFRAYNKIFNEWFRDENLQDQVVELQGDGPDDPANYTLLRRGKRHDYFTSCLPFPQKGDPVSLPLGTQAPLVGQAVAFPSGGAVTMQDLAMTEMHEIHLDSGSDYVGNGAVASPGARTWYEPRMYADLGVGRQETPYADLTQATAVTINDLREASRVQALFEADARGGTRYTEIVRRFGVVSDDARLQRPEFLGGGRQRVSVNPVAQSSASDQQPTPQGNLAAFGTTSGQNGFTKSFTEHGVIIGLACLRADLNYQQGIHRMWSREYRFDFYWPEFANLGEAPVRNEEIYADGSAEDVNTFGYQERYAEYRYRPNQITGKFRSRYDGGAQDPSLDTWHLAQDFAALPALNATFIEENPPVDRVIAVTSEPHVLLDAFFDLRCARPMPTYSVPGIKRF